MVEQLGTFVALTERMDEWDAGRERWIGPDILPWGREMLDAREDRS
jgi:hypothetical protein